MGHPSSCKDPDCTLNYRDHLLTINLSATALPTRRMTRTPPTRDEDGRVTSQLPDEPVVQTLTRERRIERDSAAYRRLHAQGYRPRRVEGSAFRERMGESEYDVEKRPVTIDYGDAT